MAEGRVFCEMLDLLFDHVALPLDKGSNGAAEAGVRDPMGAVGRHRQVAALQFMRSLRARLYPLQAALDRELDGPVIAAFEMQKAVFAVRPPIASVNRIAAQNVESTGDVVLAAPRHEQHDLVGHALAKQRKELPRQVGGAPFAVGGAEIEAEEGVPGLLGEVGTGQQVDLDAAGQCLAPLLLDRLPLSRIERGKIIVEIAVALVRPMKL